MIKTSVFLDFLSALYPFFCRYTGHATDQHKNEGNTMYIILTRIVKTAGRIRDLDHYGHDIHHLREMSGMEALRMVLHQTLSSWEAPFFVFPVPP